MAVPAGSATRPTSDRVREALFSTLESMTELAGCHFADLYAGSGAVGLEAASRGAASVLLVESDSKAVRAIRDNIARLRLAATCRLAMVQVDAVLANPPVHAFDVVFADPPYAVPEAAVARLLSVLVDKAWLVDGAVVVVERPSASPRPPWPEQITADRGRRYGETTLWYGRRS